MIYFTIAGSNILAWQIGFSNYSLKEGENVMKVLVTIKRSPEHSYLVSLVTKSIIREVRNLIENKNNSQAIDVVFKKGSFEREVYHRDIPHLKVDLILSDSYARWDLTE